MDYQIRNTILNHFNSFDYVKGRNYYPNYIEYKGMQKIQNGIYKYNFEIESENSYGIYKSYFETNYNGELVNYYCPCRQFEKTKSCKHLTAALLNYGEEVLRTHKEDINIEELSLDIFNSLKNNSSTKHVIKKQINLDIYISVTHNKYFNNFTTNLSIKIGYNKLYKCAGSKLKKLLKAIENKEVLEIGKDFIYNPLEYYFSKKDEEIINYLILINDVNYGGYDFYIPENSFQKLLELLKDKTFYLNDEKINNILNEYPLETSIEKEEDMYLLRLEDSDNLKILSSDLKLIKKEDKLYKLDDNQRDLLFQIMSNNIKMLKFKEKNLNKFTSNVLPIIKNNIKIGENVNIVISNNPKVKMYFDLLKNKIVCNLKFIYNEEEIDYFEEKENILKNVEYENEVLEDLLKYKFTVVDNKIVLENLDDIVDFIENNLQEITNKYEVYTSAKLKEVNVIKKTNVSSTFSIGKDNIMNYSFDLGDINENEIVNIFESLKNKQKYYRLKSGDIINLEEDKDLKELQELTEDMNLSNKDIQNGSGIIPKYKAIYLDSLKNDRYSIIKTNNLFDELIDKFKKYKDSNINLMEKDKKILREYQIDGVKWMYNIDQTGFGGILADEMGLGKSIQTIYLIKEIIKKEKNCKFLIVCPTSLAYNWENELKKFGQELKYYIAVGTRNKRREVLKDLKDIDIIITTYATLREDDEYYKDMSFRIMFIDEAQNIKNNNTSITKTVKRINADTKFALTGTPIENSVDELWSIFDYIMPGFLGSLDKFDKKYKIRDFDEETNIKLEKLNKQVKPFILRRKKKDVITNLPDKIENNIYVELTREQKKIYLAELDRVNKEMNEILQEEGMNKARFLILKLLTKLRQICIDPSILFTNYDGGSGKMEEFVKVVKEVVDNEHKVLIFTSFKSALDIARKKLNKENISSYVIDGSISSKKRMELVDNFNKDDTNVFFIMLKAGGTGLNLTSADVVIHLDLWWNPQAENQATDRAHRIGQKNVVEVIRFITKGTIEEKILELQNKKKILSDKLIDTNNGENSFSKLTEKDIKELLSYENKED